MNTFTPLALTALILGAPTLAAAQVAPGDQLGTSDAEIRAAIESAGYTLDEIAREEGVIELALQRNGVETEMILAAADGAVLKLENEDDDQDGDNDDGDDNNDDGDDNNDDDDDDNNDDDNHDQDGDNN
jgi:Peptidase propeptide and YPEB domain